MKQNDGESDSRFVSLPGAESRCGDLDGQDVHVLGFLKTPGWKNLGTTSDVFATITTATWRLDELTNICSSVERYRWR